jgi:hypothetical protein
MVFLVRNGIRMLERLKKVSDVRGFFSCVS